MLTQAVRHIGNVRVRQRGTIGGSLAHAEPAAELTCVLIAHGASVRALGPGGERTIAVDDLPITQLMTSLGEGELITRVEVPALTEGQGSCFIEMARRPGDFAMVNVAAIVTCDESGTCTAARLVAGRGRRPAGRRLRGRAGARRPCHRRGGKRGRRRGLAADAEVTPSSHAGIEYRREMAGGARGPGAARRLRGRRAQAQR